MSIDELLRDPNLLMQLEPEEIAVHLLPEFRNTTADGGSRVSIHNCVNASKVHHQITPPVEAALTEAYMWLVREGFIVEAAMSSGWYFISRRGTRALESGVPVNAFAQARLLPREFLHPVIAERVFAMFLRGDYESAVLVSFKEVEVEVRAAAGLPDTDYGVVLMRRAFNSDEGALADPEQIEAERRALADLFAGAIGSYKNATSHRRVRLEPAEAAEMIVLASHLLRIVDARRNAGRAAAPREVVEQL